MKTTKKALSVLLAVIMIMSSMSVCFGTFNFTATAEDLAFVDAVKCNAMKNLSIPTVASLTTANGGYATSGELVTNRWGSVTDNTITHTYTFNVSVSTYKDYLELVAVLDAFDRDLKKLTNWKNCADHSENGNCGSTANSSGNGCTDFANLEEAYYKEIKKFLSDDEIAQYNVDDLFNAIFNDKNYMKNPGTSGSTKPRPGKTEAFASLTNIINVSTADAKGYLDGKKLSDVSDNIPVKYTYKTVLTRQNYPTGLFDAYSHYHHAVNTGSDASSGAFAPGVSGNDTAVAAKVKAYATYVDTTIANNSFDSLVAKVQAGKSSEVQTLKEAFIAKRTEITNYLGSEDAFKTLYADYLTKYDNFIDNCDSALDFASLSTVSQGWIDWETTTHKNYGTFNALGFDEATIRADFSYFVTNYYNKLKANETVYNYFVGKGTISEAYYINFRDNVHAYDLKKLKDEKVAPLYNEFALSFPMEGEEPVTVAEKQVAYSNLSGYLTQITGYAAQVQNAIFPEGLTYLYDLQEKLECEVHRSVLYFAERVNVDYSYKSTQEIVDMISDAKYMYGELNGLKNSVDYSDNLTLLDPAYNNANTYIAYLYELLADRFTTQVEFAAEIYEEAGEPAKLDISSFAKLNAAFGGLEKDIITYIDTEGKGALISAETRETYNYLLNTVYPIYDAFLIDRGFSIFHPTNIVIMREDNAEEIFRENENRDGDVDPIGEYEVTDENVNNIITALEAALKDEKIAALLGSLILKDEDGTPTGEALDIGGLVRGLIDGIYSDDLINTIIQFVYPAVADVFTGVWAPLPETLEDDMNLTDSIAAHYFVTLNLTNVEDATAKLGVPLFPVQLGEKIKAEYPQFTEGVANVLMSATKKASARVEEIDGERKVIDGTIVSPWTDEALYTAKLDKDNNPVVNEETGETTMVLNLDWGIDEAENKREAFLTAASAALSGLEPLLLAILCNKAMNQYNPKIGTGDGNLGGINLTIATVEGATVDVYKIDLVLTASANTGYNDVIAPLFELLGITAPNGNNFTSVRQVLEEGLLNPLDTFINRLSANPLQTILDLLPNLAYAAEANMLLTKLELLKTDLHYSASAMLNVDLNTSNLKGLLDTWGIGDAVRKALDSLVDGLADGVVFENNMIKYYPLNDVVGGDYPVVLSEFIDIASLLGDGADLSNFAGIWGFISGLVPMLADIPAPDAGILATLGELIEIDTVRNHKTYTWGTDGKAAHIRANRADVLQYLVKWLLESGLLAGIVPDAEGFVADLFAALQENPEDVIAALVELLNQQRYPSKTYEWFNGTIGGVSVLGNSATEIYLNPNNDWTEAKAEYLYNNIDDLLTSILTMAGADFDLGTTISDAIGGLLSDKTLTALAGLLAGLDINALLAGDAEDETATAAEGEEDETEAAAPALDVNALIKDLLGIDLSAFTAENSVYTTVAAAVEANPEYVHPFGVDAGTTTFAAALAELLAPLSKVLDFILAGDNLGIKLGEKTINLLGYDGYNNGLIPLLEALGCDVVARAKLGETTELEAVINALVARIDALTEGDVIKNIIDLLPGVLYFITSNGLSTSVLNLLQPVVVIIDTIRPVINVMDLINNIEVGEEGAKKTLKELLGGEINLERLDVNFIFKLLPTLLPDLDLSGLKNVIYDVCKYIGVEYTSKSTLQSTWKKGAYITNAEDPSKNFTQADMLTVLLSFVLEWATVKENAAKLDELLKTNGLISSITGALNGIKVNYATPDWMYWFESEEEFKAYVNGDKALPDTLAALAYPNDWNEETAKYLAEKLASLVDMVIALINKDEGEDAPKTLSALLTNLLNGLVNDQTMNDLVAMITSLLANIDETLIDTVGVIIDADIAGLKDYNCTAGIDSLEDFAIELGRVLDTYAGRLVQWIFFDDSYEFARTSTNNSTIVLNGGKGYEKGLALILEALGCEKLPTSKNATEVLKLLAARVTKILAKPVDEILAILPNLVYFLNANGAGVAVSNMLAPIVNLLDALAIENVKLDLADLIKITKDDGTVVKLNLGALTLANIVNFVEELTGLNLVAVENLLVDFCVGKIVNYGSISEMPTFKMVADKADVVTIVLTTALAVINTEGNADVIGVEIIKNIKKVFNNAPVTYVTPNWDYCWDKEDINYVEGTIGVIESALTYPNDWTEEKSVYLAGHLSSLVDTVVKMVTKNDEATLATIIDEKVNIYTPDLLKTIQTALGDLLGGLDEDIQALVNVGFGAADKLLGADVQGLLEYDVSGVKDKETFVAALTGMLMEVEGLVDWLLLGEDYKLFVDDKNNNGAYDDGEDIITLNGAHGYAEGLALLLEALGCKNLPTVYDVEGEIDTEATVSAVLTSLANRIDEVLDNPIDEALDLLPNLIYFLNTNGVAAVIDNLTGAFTALATKLAGFGLNLDLNALINIPKLMKIEGKGATISLDNLAMKDILQAVSLMLDLDLTVLEGTLNGFALGNVQAYPSVSRTDVAFKMGYKNEFDKHDMITVLVTALLLVVETEGNAESLKKLLGENIYNALRDVFAGGNVAYVEPNWDYDQTKYEVEYPNNWTETTAEEVTKFLLSKDFDKLITGLIDKNYASLGELLTAKVDVFTTENLNALVKIINDLLSGIDAGLIEGAGILLDAKLVGEKSLATYTAPEGIKTVKAFAKELAKVLTTYAPGVVEWLLLGQDYRFFVNDADGDAGYTYGEDIITISGANGYTEGLALLLEALGCENLPSAVITEENTTAKIIEGVLTSLAARIEVILANPVVEVINLLPNLFYFLNTNGVAAVVDNTLAAVFALLSKLEAFGVKLNINDLVNLKSLMGLEDTEATISLDNLAMKDILQAVSLMVGLDLTYIEKVLVGFGLGETTEYDTSVSTQAGTPKKMIYTTDFANYDMVTVLANLVLITIADEDNAAFVKNLAGEEIYKVILDILNLEENEAPIQYMKWQATDKVGQIFNALETSPTYKGFEYGPLYTKEMAQYIADNIGDFIDNIIYLLGLEINGVNVDSLESLLNNLVGGSLYNSDLVITIRDALAGLAGSIEGLEVNGVNVGKTIVTVLKTAKIADLKAIGNVKVDEFSDNREMFVEALCDVLEPAYGLLTWLLADEDLAFFVDVKKNDFITLPGAEGYRNGIALLLEAIGCKNLPTELNGEGDALVKAILNPLLNRLDVIFANPAEEILAVLTNVIYFINSKGVDVVIKNTLNAVYTVLNAIEPIAKVDLYELVGLDDYVTLSAEELINMLLDMLKDTGFDFSMVSVDFFSELTIGKLTQYTSISAEGAEAYKMVYDAKYASKADMITAVMRLVITFILTDNNREVLVDLLKDVLGMSADAEKYVSALLKAFADSIVGKKGEDLRLGMDSVLVTIYYIFYGLDTGVDNTVAGKKDLDKLWAAKIKELNDNSPSENTQVGDLITDIFDIIFNDEGKIPEGGGNDVADKEEIAPNGFIAFFQRIAKFFEEIGEFFRNLFSFGK